MSGKPADWLWQTPLTLSQDTVLSVIKVKTWHNVALTVLNAGMTKPLIFYCTLYSWLISSLYKNVFSGCTVNAAGLHCTSMYSIGLYFLVHMWVRRLWLEGGTAVFPSASSPCYFPLISPCPQWGGWVRDLPPTHNHGRGRRPLNTPPLKCSWALRPPQASAAPSRTPAIIVCIHTPAIFPLTSLSGRETQTLYALLQVASRKNVRNVTSPYHFTASQMTGNQTDNGK